MMLLDRVAVIALFEHIWGPLKDCLSWGRHLSLLLGILKAHAQVLP